MTVGQDSKVVVAGLGAVTSQGPDAAAFWDGVRAGRVAINPVRHLSMDGLLTRIAGEVADVPPAPRRYLRPGGFVDRAFAFALQAADEAFRAAGLDTTAIPAERWGAVIGTCNAGLLAGVHWYLEHAAGRDPDPRLVLLVPPQAIAEAIGGAFGLRGPLLSIDTACAAGANAVGYAADLVRQGRADAMLAGGTDALSDVLIGGFNSLESLSPEPAAPYSEDRLGLSLGEGSGMLVLVREDLARHLGAPVLAEIAGYGLSADGYHPTAPHPEGLGAARAIRAALHSAGTAPTSVAYVNSHGTGTAKNDPAETRATKAGLGEAAARSAAVSSTKSMIGHLLGAAGAVEALVTVRAITDQVAPPTANFTRADPDCDLDYVPNTARPLAIDVAVSNNFAFGGANASLVLRRPGVGPVPPRPPTDRVVVTGVGVLTPAGNDAAALYDAVLAGAPVTVPEDGVPLGRVVFSPHDFLTAKQRRRVDRLGLFSIVVTHLALQDAGLPRDGSAQERVGVVLGTGVGPMEAMEEFARPLFAEGPRAANPAIFPNTVYNAAAGQVAIKLGLVGPTSTVTAGHAAGASALAYCHDLVRGDHADGMVALAADVLTDTVVRAYRGLPVLAGAGDRPEDGYALSEAAVALVLERAAAAAARGAAPYGQVLGYGIAADGLGVGRWDRTGAGTERALRLALADAGTAPEELGAVYAGAAGYARADRAEQAAIERVLDGAPVRVHAPKAVLGEPIGAGGAVSAAVALVGLRRGDLTGPVLVSSSSLGGTHFAVVLGPVR